MTTPFTTKLSFCAILSVIAPSLINAQEAKGLKYGVLDMQAVILNVEEGKSARAKLEKEIKAKEAEFQKEKQALDKMNEEWKSQVAMLSEQARMEKQQEFQQKFMTLRNAEMAFQDEIKRKEQDATSAIAMKVAQLVDGMAAKENFDIVFERNSSGLLYLKDPIDITPRVIEEFPKFKVAANKEDKSKKKK
jgi:outer membrane protein